MEHKLNVEQDIKVEAELTPIEIKTHLVLPVDIYTPPLGRGAGYNSIRKWSDKVIEFIGEYRNWRNNNAHGWPPVELPEPPPIAPGQAPNPVQSDSEFLKLWKPWASIWNEWSKEYMIWRDAYILIRGKHGPTGT